MSDGMCSPTVGGEATCAAAGEAQRMAAALKSQTKRWRGRMRLAPVRCLCRDCRLSKCDAPGVLECRPRPEGITPIYSVMQQQPLQEKHLGPPLPFWASTNAQPARWFRSARPARNGETQRIAANTRKAIQVTCFALMT